MSASDAFENDILKHFFNNVAIANVGDATGLPASATAGSLYVSLHTGNPSETGSQNSSEANYTGYARVAVARTTGGWSVVANVVSNAAVITFPGATGGTNTITHFSVGTTASGAGKVMFYGALDQSLAISSGITPSFAIGDLTVEVD